MESEGNQNGKTRNTTVRSRSRRRAARPRGRTDTYCICQVFASYRTPAVRGWKTEPPPTQRAQGLGQAGGVAGRGAGRHSTLSQGVTSRRGRLRRGRGRGRQVSTGCGRQVQRRGRGWRAGAAALRLRCELSFFCSFFLKKKSYFLFMDRNTSVRAAGVSRRRRDQSGHAALRAQARAPSPRQGTSSGRNPCKSGNREDWGFFLVFFFFVSFFVCFCFVL